MTMLKHHISRYVLAFLLPLALLVGCTGPSEEEADIDRAEIQSFLEEYLPKMAEAYATGDLEPVKDDVSEREVAVLRKNVRDLATQGRTVKTELQELTIEEINPLSYATVSVTTVEEWSVQVYAQGTENLLAEDPSQFNRVQYQLERDDGAWTLMARHSQTLED